MAFATSEGLYIISRERDMPITVKIDDISPRIVRVGQDDYTCAYDGETIWLYLKHARVDMIPCDLDVVDIQFGNGSSLVILVLDSHGELYAYKMDSDDKWLKFHIWTKVSWFCCNFGSLVIFNDSEECVLIDANGLVDHVLTGPTPILGARGNMYWGENWMCHVLPDARISRVNSGIKTAMFRYTITVYLNDCGEVVIRTLRGSEKVIYRDVAEILSTPAWLCAVNYDSELCCISPMYMQLATGVICSSGDSSSRSIKSA